MGDGPGCPSKPLAVLMRSGPAGRLRWPLGLWRGGRGSGHGRLPGLWQLQEAGHLHPHRPLRGLDRRRHGLRGWGGGHSLRAPQGPAPCHGLLLPAWPEHSQCHPTACHGLPPLPTPLPERPHKPRGGLGQGAGEEPRKGVPGSSLTSTGPRWGRIEGHSPSTGFAEGAQNAACDCCNKVMMIPAELLGWRSGVKEGDGGVCTRSPCPGGAGHGVGDAKFEPLGMVWPRVGAGDTSCSVATMSSRSGISHRVTV